MRAIRNGPRLLWAADPLLMLIPRLRASRSVSDLGALREQTAQMLRAFQARARAAGLDTQRVAQASNVLAALVDHVVTSMPWGSAAGWRTLAPATSASSVGQPSQRLLEVARASRADVGMRELIAVALGLGFDERTPSADDAALAQVRAELIPVDSAPAHDALDVLSARWSAAVQRTSTLAGWLPVWVSCVCAAAALAVLFFGLRLSLGAQSNRVFTALSMLHDTREAAARPLPALQPRLASSLPEAIARQRVFVRDDIDRSVIVIPEKELFAAGSAVLHPDATPVLRELAAALRTYPGRVSVIGHTDGTLVASARYPSEWELSVDRSRAVSDALRKLGVASERLTFDGRANVEPLQTAELGAAAGSGRIEIQLLVGR